MAVSPRLSQKSEIMSNSTGGPAPVKPRQMRVGFRTCVSSVEPQRHGERWQESEERDDADEDERGGSAHWR